MKYPNSYVAYGTRVHLARWSRLTPLLPPFRCINEQLYMRMADAMVSGGYVAAGYNRVNIDDCWAAKERAADGSLQANATRFPHGIKVCGCLPMRDLDADRV